MDATPLDRSITDPAQLEARLQAILSVLTPGQRHYIVSGMPVPESEQEWLPLVEEGRWLMQAAPEAWVKRRWAQAALHAQDYIITTVDNELVPARERLRAAGMVLDRAHGPVAGTLPQTGPGQQIVITQMVIVPPEAQQVVEGEVAE